MYINDFGLWVKSYKWTGGKRIVNDSTPEEFDFSELGNYRTAIVYNGNVLCRLRESTKNYLWLESICNFKSSLKNTTADLNVSAKTRSERVRLLKEKLEDSIDKLQKINYVLECMEKNNG